MILYRYIIKEHIFPFLVSLSVIVFLFVMQQAVFLLDKIISKGIDPLVILEVFLIQLGWIIALAVPMAILTSTLITFGRMAGDNEITSIKASGQSLLSLLVPVLSASTVLAVLLVYFNNEILPDANHRTANLLSDISRTRPAAFIEPGVLIRDFTGYTIYTEEVNPVSGEMNGIKIYSDSPDQDPSITVADSGMIRMTPDQQFLELTLFDGETHSVSSNNKEEYFTGKFEKQIICIKNVESGLQRTSSDYRSDREKSSSEMLADIRNLEESNDKIIADFNRTIDSLKEYIQQLDSASKNSDHINKSNEDSLSLGTWIAAIDSSGKKHSVNLRRKGDYLEQILRRIRSNNMMISQYLVEVHKKYSIPFACIIFVLIGAPLGIMARKGGYAVGASYSIFFFIINWAFLIAGESLADKMIISPVVAMWSGNVLIGLCGIVLIIMMLRETTIRFDSIISLWRNTVNKEKSIVKKMSGSFLFKIPRIIFWTPRLISRLFIGRLPTYLIGIFLGFSAGLMIAIIVIFIVIDYVSNLKKFQGVLFSDVLLYYWYYLPWIIQIMIPIVLLLASMFSLGRLAKNSELIAMKASGINIRQLTFPLLFLGLFLAVGTFYGGEWILPNANQLRNDLSQNMKNQVRPDRNKNSAREFRRDFYYFGNPQTIYFFKEFSTAPENFRNINRDTRNDLRQYRMEFRKCCCT
jgi:lipopolysaccharide export system permease protein